MTTPLLFKEYIWLVNTIHDAGGITLKEINEKWTATEMSGGVELSRSTFRRHKDAIEEIFGIYIECDRNYRYSIGNGDALGRDSVQQWMLQTLTGITMCLRISLNAPQSYAYSTTSSGNYI